MNEKQKQSERRWQERELKRSDERALHVGVKEQVTHQAVEIGDVLLHMTVVIIVLLLLGYTVRAMFKKQPRRR